MKHLSLLVCVCISVLFLGKINAQTNPFGSKILAFEKTDSLYKPVQEQILLYGSSSIRMWESYEKDFSNRTLKVINRGFGGSQTSDANFYFDRIVAPHKPKIIFFYEGENDINAGKSVEKILLDIKTFIQKTKRLSPETRIVFFAIKPSPSRTQDFDKQKEFNLRLKQLVRKDDHLYCIDLFSKMLDKDGRADPKFFKEDRLHMNSEGYAIWTKEVQKLLKKWGL
ncbi:MAG: GDSL-type esterase/lipase family protein [Sediminibacterium sp.]|nr:GDSL-type esterase/lipase family protein [Sediminibacterium sp.]